MHNLFRVIVILLVCCLAMARTTVLAVSNGNQENSVIIVNERALVGPNSASQLRGGRLFLPVAAIAQALGDTFSSDSTTRVATVRRQNGTTAIFNAQLNEVRERRGHSHRFRNR